MNPIVMKTMADKFSSIINNCNVEYRDFIAIISAIKYHSHSLDSMSEENQLLDLFYYGFVFRHVKKCKVIR